MLVNGCITRFKILSRLKSVPNQSPTFTLIHYIYYFWFEILSGKGVANVGHHFIRRSSAMTRKMSKFNSPEMEHRLVLDGPKFLAENPGSWARKAPIRDQNYVIIPRPKNMCDILINGVLCITSYM